MFFNSPLIFAVQKNLDVFEPRQRRNKRQASQNIRRNQSLLQSSRRRK